MGNQSSKKTGYCELRDSIPGLLIAEQDFELFYSLCKVETVRTMTTVLCPIPHQLFFVVVSGEVTVHLTSPDVRSKVITATTFMRGEVIHFFNSTLRAHNASFDFGECLKNGDIRMALNFKSHPKSVARVIGMDRMGLEEFMLNAKFNFHRLKSFLDLSIVDTASKSPFFKTITPEQVRLYVYVRWYFVFVEDERVV